MNRVAFLLVLVILAGCSPQRRLARLLERYPIPADTIVKDSIVYQDRDVIVELPGDTVEKIVEIDIPKKLPDTTIHARTDYAKASAGLLNNDLWLRLVQTDTMVVVQVDSVEVTKFQDRIITRTVPEIVEPKSFKFYRSGFFIFGVLIVLTLVLYFTLRKN